SRRAGRLRRGAVGRTVACLLVCADALNKSEKTSADCKTVQTVARIATDAPDQRAEEAMVGNPARRLVAALAFVFATAGIAPAASATLTVGKSAPNADPIIPVNVGEELGIFKKHGLDLKIVDFTGGSKMTQAMAAGALDIGDGAGTEMALVAKGAPMIAICETAGPIPFIGIGVPWDSPIQTIDQLKGKKIGYSSAGSLTDWLTRELARKQGWAPQDVTGVSIGNGASSIIAAFREHLIDADVAVTSLFLAMEENKTGRLLF